METVSKALHHFRVDVLMKKKWDYRKGETLRTYFVGQCLIRFANIYRAWYGNEARRRQHSTSGDEIALLRVFGALAECECAAMPMSRGFRSYRIDRGLIAAYTRQVTAAQFDRITVDPDVLGGKPCIRGLRISVGMIVQMFAAGKTAHQIVDEYPYLELEDIQQSLAYSTVSRQDATTVPWRPVAVDS